MSVMKHFCVIIAVACKYLVATAGVDALNSMPLVIDDLFKQRFIGMELRRKVSWIRIGSVV